MDYFNPRPVPPVHPVLPAHSLTALNALMQSRGEISSCGEIGPWGPAPQDWTEEEGNPPLTGWEAAVNTVIYLACGTVLVWFGAAWVWGMVR